jgi:hypothetical protein
MFEDVNLFGFRDNVDEGAGFSGSLMLMRFTAQGVQE